MAKWVRVASAGDIALNGSVAVDVAGHSVLVARLDDGFHAIRNLCSHQSRPLQGGAIVDGAVECPAHGARFNLRTGARLSMPAIVGVKSFPARLQGGDVEVDEDAVAAALGAPLD